MEPYVTNCDPAQGCKHCVKGEKLVLFITGICPNRCIYCPVSEDKFGKDDVYANEWKINSFDDLLTEIKLTNAKGAGITGGDPLARLEKTVEYIKFLKSKFDYFHIHLYTTFTLVTRKHLKQLYDAGLDEIRFHPNLDDTSLWEKIELAKEFNWDVGIEIPCLLEYEKVKRVVDYFDVDFINLNELEVSDTEIEHYDLSHETLDYSYAVRGSREVALKVMKNTKKPIYFCSASLKDKTQMGNRIKKRSENVKEEYDEVTEEGMLIRGAIYIHTPGKRETGTTQELETVKEKILGIEDVRLDIDTQKNRLLTFAEFVHYYKDEIKKLGFVPAVVEEYPTKEGTEIDIELL